MSFSTLKLAPPWREPPETPLDCTPVMEFLFICSLCFPPIFLHHGGVPWCSLKSFERDCLRVVCWHLQIWSDLVVAILDCFHIDSWIVPHVQCVFSIIPAEKNCVLELSHISYHKHGEGVCSMVFFELEFWWFSGVCTCTRKQYPHMSTRVFVFHCLPFIGTQHFCSRVDHNWRFLRQIGVENFCMLL